MARFVSFSPFNTTGTPGAGGLTLDALMRRQELLAKNGTKLPGATEMASPWQGAAYLGNVLSDSLSEARTRNDTLATRDALAKVAGGIDYNTGATDDQIRQVAQYDPEQAKLLLQQRLDRAKEERGYTQQNLNREDQQTFQEGQQQAGFTHADTAQQAGFTHADTAQEDQQQAAKDAAALAETNRIEEEKRKAAASQKRIVSGDEAKQLGGDPNRQYTVSEDGTTLTDITPTPKESYGDVLTGDQAAAQGLDPKGRWQKGSDGKWTRLSEGSVPQVGAELKAKLGLAKQFTDMDYATVVDSITKGELSGATNTAQLAMGMGRPAEIYRKVKGGSEALVRLLTGAGKSESEARDEVASYLPQATDSDHTKLDKVKNLYDRLNAVANAVGQGNPIPDAGAGDGAGAGATGAVPPKPASAAAVDDAVWAVMTPEERAAFP